MEGSNDENPPPPPPQTPTQQAPHTVSTIKLPILKKGVSTKDDNQKFLRSLPSSWSQVSLVMRTKPGVDSLSFDDLYNNLRVFESDVKGSIGSSSSAQNVAFVFSKSTSSTNDVSTAYGVSTSSGYKSQRENSSSYTNELRRDGLEMASSHDFNEIEEVLQEGRLTYPIWEVIQKGNGPVCVSTDTNEVIKVLPPKTVNEILARERERKARTTLLMDLSEDYLAKFHKMTDAKDTWDAIKSRFGGNDESKKMQKYILKQQFEGFSVSNSAGLHKGYDRFQSLQSQLEIHGAGVSTEDANQKFLRVFESDIKGSTGSSSSAQNVAFVSSESTSSTNDVSTAHGVSTSSGYNSQRENSSSYTDELILKKFYKKTSRRLQFDVKEPVGFDKTKVECFNCHKTGHFARECRSKGNQESRRRDAWNTGYKAKDNGRRPRK
ncbi:ribonuclease H-like domain-containing protein [Tanacetum coccineum]